MTEKLLTKEAEGGVLAGEIGTKSVVVLVATWWLRLLKIDGLEGWRAVGKVEQKIGGRYLTYLTIPSR